jgi:transposase
MWTKEQRAIYWRDEDRYPSNLTDVEWERLKPLIPEAGPGGRPRKTDIRAAMNAIFYLLRTGCPWRYLPRDEFRDLNERLAILRPAVYRQRELVDHIRGTLSAVAGEVVQARHRKALARILDAARALVAAAAAERSIRAELLDNGFEAIDAFTPAPRLAAPYPVGRRNLVRQSAVSLQEAARRAWRSNMKRQLPKRQRQDGERRAKRARAASAMSTGAKSLVRAVPVPTRAKRQSVAPVGRGDK